MDGPRSVRPTHYAVPAAHLFFLSAHPYHPAVETRHKARFHCRVRLRPRTGPAPAPQWAWWLFFLRWRGYRLCHYQIRRCASPGVPRWFIKKQLVTLITKVTYKLINSMRHMSLHVGESSVSWLMRWMHVKTLNLNRLLWCSIRIGKQYIDYRCIAMWSVSWPCRLCYGVCRGSWWELGSPCMCDLSVCVFSCCGRI